METLFDLLFGNAFFIILIIGIVSSLFKRFKTDARPGNLKKDYKGTDPFGGTSARAASSMSRQDILQTDVLDVIPAKTGVYHDLGLEQAINSEKREIELERRFTAARSAVVNSKKTSIHQEKPKRLEFGQDQIVHGILMAEILGKPKGHTSRYRRAKSAAVLKK
ncbi:hypothetical protein JOC77_001218 [Peribacillus deserti]|uniref:Uncharacterized protein n=1 Tax=Peribacillus deserti TaxID=673318 RepID=A0ABS2QH25_9BACI|nr:hypothetical protein [Peribacillus deserti]MBM7691808.1 hypothetical protein [Peribacillus deserti]